jgi:hypothetical protein
MTSRRPDGTEDFPSPAAPPQRHHSPNQKGLSLNVTCPTARVRPEELT